MQNNNRFFVAGQNAGRAKNSNDTTRLNAEVNWFLTALKLEKKENQVDAGEQFNRGIKASRQITAGMYL